MPCTSPLPTLQARLCARFPRAPTAVLPACLDCIPHCHPYELPPQLPGPLGLTCHSFYGDVEVSAVQGLGGPRAIALRHGGCLLLQGALF